MLHQTKIHFFDSPGIVVCWGKFCHSDGGGGGGGGTDLHSVKLCIGFLGFDLIHCFDCGTSMSPKTFSQSENLGWPKFSGVIIWPKMP